MDKYKHGLDYKVSHFESLKIISEEAKTNTESPVAFQRSGKSLAFRCCKATSLLAHRFATNGNLSTG